MNIEQQLVDYFKNLTDVEVIPDTPLIESSLIDSMGVMSLIAFLEHEYGLDFDMDDLTIENFATISHITSLINRKRQEL